MPQRAWTRNSSSPAGSQVIDPELVGPRLGTAFFLFNKHFTLKQSPIQRTDFDEFVECYKPGKLHTRKPTWTESNSEGRWRCYDYEELLKRDKLSLDLFWIKDQSLTDTDKLPAPDILATEIADDLEAALELFTKVAARLLKSGGARLTSTSLGIDAE